MSPADFDGWALFQPGISRDQSLTDRHPPSTENVPGQCEPTLPGQLEKYSGRRCSRLMADMHIKQQRHPERFCILQQQASRFVSLHSVVTLISFFQDCWLSHSLIHSFAN